MSNEDFDALRDRLMAGLDDDRKDEYFDELMRRVKAYTETHPPTSMMDNGDGTYTPVWGKVLVGNG